MPFANRTQAQNETSAARRRPGLIRMGNDAGIEQRRRFERILIEEIGTDQPPLFLRESRMRGERVFHFIGARLETGEQITVASLEILQHFGELVGGRLRIERQDSIDNVIRACLVRGVQVPRFGRRFEWAHHHPRRIRAQIQSLPVQKRGW